MAFEGLVQSLLPTAGAPMALGPHIPVLTPTVPTTPTAATSLLLLPTVP